MNIPMPSLFGLHHDIPRVDLDTEWRALVSEQARTLSGMLQRLQTAGVGVHRWTDARALQALTADAECLLAAQAHQHVCLERELGQLRALVTDLDQVPAEMTQRVQRLEH